jgi:V-type H+-transporting ATPase subunit A
MVTGGDILGSCFENNLFDEHRILLPPRARGKIVNLATDGDYTVKDKIIEIEYEGKV